MLCMTALVVAAAVSAQRLVLLKNYGSNWDREMVSTVNKANGYIYRLREDVRALLPGVEETEGLQLFIAEPIDIGWLGLFRLPLAADDYNFVVVIYNQDQEPQQVVNLCDITGNRYCEVQDVRWDADNHHLLFNMACPSYASMIDGKGSKLYCYDVEHGRMVWETDYLVSNDIFIMNKKYVFCSYGFTNEKKFLFMLDKLTGKVYSKLPMVWSVQYMELQQQNGKEVLYAVDYDERLYSFAISNSPAPKRTTTTAKKKVARRR